MGSTFVSFVSFVVEENVLRYTEGAHGEQLRPLSIFIPERRRGATLLPPGL